MGRVTLWGLLICLLLTFCTAYNSPPSLQDKVASRVVAKLGRTTKLRCPADSNPDLTTWKKDGQALNLGFGKYQVSNEGALRIRNTEMVDAGVYTCTAVNGYGSININYTVIVFDEKNKVFQENGKVYKQNPNEDLNREGHIPIFPDIKKMEESRILRKPTGYTLKLVCKVEGYPEPEVQWLKDGELVNNERRSHTTLKIHHVSEADSGSYTCVARNRLGQRNFTYSVQVIGKIQEKPKLIAPHPLNRTVAVGDYVSFQCDIESVVEPVVQWLKRVEDHEEFPDKTLISPNDNEKYRVLKNAGVLLERSDGSFLNKLVIQHVRPQDQGKFVCLAMNKVGSTSRHAFLQVRPRNAGDQLNPSLRPAQSPGDPASGDLEPASQNSSDDINLPLFIGLSAFALLIIIILVVIFMQRNNRCRCSNSTSNKVPRTPVPPQEREAYYYSQQQHLQQSVNPLLQQSREKSSKTPTPSLDMTGSEFSSVSRTHPPPHFYHHNNHMNYGY